MALWPISSSYYYSGLDVFADISRRYWKPEEFILKNAVSIAREIVILGPMLAWPGGRASAAFRFCRRKRVSVEAEASTSSAERPCPNPEPHAPDP